MTDSTLPRRSRAAALLLLVAVGLWGRRRLRARHHPALDDHHRCRRGRVDHHDHRGRHDHHRGTDHHAPTTTTAADHGDHAGTGHHDHDRRTTTTTATTTTDRADHHHGGGSHRRGGHAAGGGDRRRRARRGGGSCCCWPGWGSSAFLLWRRSHAAPPWAERAASFADEIDAAGRSVLLGPELTAELWTTALAASNAVRARADDLLDHAPTTAARQAVSEAVEALRQAEVQATAARSGVGGAGDRDACRRRAGRGRRAPPRRRDTRRRRRARDLTAGTYARRVPAEIEPVELARVVDFAERSRVGDWSLRSALVRYAEGQPERVSQVLEQVRRSTPALHPLRQGAREARRRAVGAPSTAATSRRRRRARSSTCCGSADRARSPR